MAPFEVSGEAEEFSSTSLLHLEMLFEPAPLSMPSLVTTELEDIFADLRGAERQISDDVISSALTWASMYRKKQRDCLRLAYACDTVTRQLNNTIDSLLNIIYWADASRCTSCIGVSWVKTASWCRRARRVTFSITLCICSTHYAARRSRTQFYG